MTGASVHPKSGAARIVAGACAHPAWVAFVTALVPRLVFLYELRARSPTFEAPEGGDSILYDRLASGVPEPVRAYFHSPLYIEFLKILYRIYGRNLFAVRLTQHVIGAIGCALVAHVTLKVLRSRPAALGAGLLAAVLGPVIFYEGQLGVDGLMPFLVMGCVALAMDGWRRKKTLTFAMLGAVIGLTALGRPVVLAWIPFLLLWEVLPRPRRWMHCVALLAGTFVMIMPVTISNWRAEKTFILITANGGLNLFIGNNEAANGAYVLPQGVAFRPGDVADDFEGRRAAEDAEGKKLNSAGVSAWWSKRAWAFIRKEPGQEVWLALLKAQLLTSDTEYTQLHDYAVYREVAPVLGVLPTAGYVVVPGLAGLIGFFLKRERRPVAKRLAILWLVFAGSFIPFFVVGRYRVPLLLLILPFAVMWVKEVTAFYRQGAWRSLLLPGTLAAAVAVVATLPMNVPSTGFQYMNFARAALDKGDRRDAAHWCERALHDDPNNVEAVALLGRLRRQEGRYDDAEQVLEASVKQNPQNAAAWLELGRLRMETGHPDSAIEALRASIDADPRSLETWSALAAALHAAGQEEDAQAAERSYKRLSTAIKPPE